MSHAMKGFTVAAFVLLLAVSAAAEPATAVTKLNLRSGPGPAFGIIAMMPTGTKLEVLKCTDEWCRVKLGRQPGYASRSLLRIGAEAYASAAPQASPAPPEPKPTLTGPRVWQWNDSNWRNEHWRRLDWHNRMRH